MAKPKGKCHNCETKCGKGKVSPEVAKKLEEAFKRLSCADSNSLLKKYLSKSVFEKLKDKKTSFNSTLLDCIQSGVENLDSGCGIYAPDPEAYTLFADIFDPIIEDYHLGFGKSCKHPPTDWGDVSSIGDVDPTGEYVVSTRVRCGRSLQGYPFNPNLSEIQYKEIEKKVSGALTSLTGELKGKYYPLEKMTKTDQQQLIDDHFLFKEGDRFLQAAQACRFWPRGRGIYHNDNKTFLVWINEEDHIRIISMQMGGNLGEVYTRLVCAVHEIEKTMSFSRSDRFGYLTFCPTNLGTIGKSVVSKLLKNGSVASKMLPDFKTVQLSRVTKDFDLVSAGTTIRASVHIKVPKLAKDKSKLDSVAQTYSLQVRGTRGEHTDAEDGVYDISNKRRLGLTEYEAVKEMHDGIVEIIKLESSL